MNDSNLWIVGQLNALVQPGLLPEDETIVGIAYGTSRPSSISGVIIFKIYVSGIFKLEDAKCESEGSITNLKEILVDTSGLTLDEAVKYANTMAIKGGSKVRFKA